MKHPMSNHTRLWAAGTLLAGAFGLAGCGAAAALDSAPTTANTVAAPAGPGSTSVAGNASTSAAGSASTSAAVTAPPGHGPIVGVVDPCSLITADEAKAAIGGDPGSGKPLTGSPSCSYGTPGQGTGQLIVFNADARVAGIQSATQDNLRAGAQKVADSSGGTVQDTSGIGDFGYVVVSPGIGVSYLFFVKGSTMVSVILQSTSPTTADVMMTLGKAAAGRL